MARDDICLDLAVPITRIGFGIFSIDPLEKLLGKPIDYFLEPLMRGEKYRRPSAGGPAVEVFPLRLPEGEGLSIPLGQFGELGFRNKRGLLELTVPTMSENFVLRRFADYLVSGPNRVLSADGSTYVSSLTLRLVPGARSSIALGAIGELGIEVARPA